MRLAHTNNAKSREHAHTCRKARAILKLRYKNKTNSFCGTVDLSQLPQGLKRLCLSDNELSGEVFISDKLFDRVSVRYTKLIKRHME